MVDFGALDKWLIWYVFARNEEKRMSYLTEIPSRGIFLYF